MTKYILLRELIWVKLQKHNIYVYENICMYDVIVFDFLIWPPLLYWMNTPFLVVYKTFLILDKKSVRFFLMNYLSFVCLSLDLFSPDFFLILVICLDLFSKNSRLMHCSVLDFLFIILFFSKKISSILFKSCCIFQNDGYLGDNLFV